MHNASKTKGVNYIVHFTRKENVNSILRNGIVPRSLLSKLANSAIFNDGLRLDNQENASCFSITFPNYKMFYKYRMEDPESKWVVIGIKASVLWEKTCAFCVTNAANVTVSSTNIQQRLGLGAFLKLFEEVEGKPTRKDMKLHDCFTTDPQAEVLVFDTVEPTYIAGIGCYSHGDVEELSARHPGFDFKHLPFLFKYRYDYENWR